MFLGKNTGEKRSFFTKFKFKKSHELKCSFCAKTQYQVRKLVAGPDVYICDECIEICMDIVEEKLGKLGEETSRNNRELKQQTPEPGELKCSFCGYSQSQLNSLIAGPGVYICDECVELCEEIVEEELGVEKEDTFDTFDDEENKYLDEQENNQSEPDDNLKQTVETRCSFCGLSRSHVRVLVASEDAYICDGCTEKYAKQWRTDGDDFYKNDRFSCSFCHKSHSEVAKMITNSAGNYHICNNCIEISVETAKDILEKDTSDEHVDEETNTVESEHEIGHSEELYCSFCGHSQHNVQKLVAGPGVYICDECIEICVYNIEKELEKIGKDAWRRREPNQEPVQGELCCSFCGYSVSQVNKLIAGPDVYICDDCTELCKEIIDEELGKDTSNSDENQQTAEQEIESSNSEQDTVGPDKMDIYIKALGQDPLQLNKEELERFAVDAQKKWLKRINAPSLERRQEAERMLVIIEEIKETFL